MRDRLIGVTEARKELSDLVDQVKGQDIVLLRHNAAVAVLTHPDRIERLVSRIEDLEDTVAAMESRLFPERTLSTEELRRELGLDDAADQSVAATG